jgi:hypothetical protein
MAGRSLVIRWFGRREYRMTPTGLRKRLLVSLAVSTLLIGVTAYSAQARATVGTFFNQSTEVNQVGTPECVSGDFSGTETLTDTDSGRFVETDSGFHFEGTETIVSHTVFTNGYYIVGSGRSHISFNTTATSGQTVSTFAGHELHTLYNAQGQVVAKVMFAGVSHITFRDLNGNGQPDEGEITSNVDNFHFTCI